MFYLIKRFFGKIFRIIDYIPVLWNDEDWDFEYILPILKKKIDRLGKCIRKNNIILRSEDVYQETRDAMQAIDNFTYGYEMFRDIYGEPNSKIIFDNEDEYYIASYYFEQDCWNEIWDIIKNNARRWWD